MSFRQASTIPSLHRMLQQLKDKGYTGEMVFSYNGCGDSGDIEHPQIDSKLQGTLDALGWCMEYAKGGYTYTNNNSFVNNDPNHDRCVLSLVNELLPGGWEINEGSYGKVVLSIDKVEIKVMHNQNITTTEYSEEVYCGTSANIRLHGC